MKNEHSTSMRKRRVALITGAARRLGAVIAKTLHAEGFNIVVHCNTSQLEANQLVQELNSIRAQSTISVQADLSNLCNCEPIINAAISEWGQLDILVNNASTYYPTEIGSVSHSQWHDLVDINLKIPFFLIQTAMPWLHQVRGNIVNIVDINAQRPLKGYPVYCAAKAGLALLTEALALELAPNIRVNGVAPGTIMWPEKSNKLDDNEKLTTLKKIPLGRIGDGKDIAEAVRFLTISEYITGHIIRIDGGAILSR
ncbi:pteridine reductase [Photorhabdus laumondii]|uniref:pteridine reductase n=1 Tax=Photorhabdus laumondii TaxID=2218628 RepID=UPI0025AEEDDB|nr:pteridine reductase [Photorhabdus laumondii]